jgi:sulfide:quinone oxidoreductase
MTSDPAPSAPFDVLIAGGGVAALEAVLALRDLAGDRVRITVVTPGEDFVYRPLSVRAPFSFGGAERYSLAEITDELGVTRIVDELHSVDPEGRTATTASGRELGYDALLVAVGARIQPHYAHAVTIDDRRLEELLRGLVQDVEDGYAKRIAFLVPARMAWPFPIYELALMIAGRAYDSDLEATVTIVTPEDGPLGVFGTEASNGVAELLAARGIEVISSAYAEVAAPGRITITPGERHLEVDRIVALPELEVSGLDGLPQTEHGFLPIDEHAAVIGLDRVYAAGDNVDFPIKHGGLASQQADAAATAIAALAGAPVEPQPFDPRVEGVLLTGDKPRYLRAYIAGGHGTSSEISEVPLDSDSKIAARYLGPFLAAREARSD